MLKAALWQRCPTEPMPSRSRPCRCHIRKFGPWFRPGVCARLPIALRHGRSLFSMLAELAIDRESFMSNIGKHMAKVSMCPQMALTHNASFQASSSSMCSGSGGGELAAAAVAEAFTEVWGQQVAAMPFYVRDGSCEAAPLDGSCRNHRSAVSVTSSASARTRACVRCTASAQPKGRRRRWLLPAPLPCSWNSNFDIGTSSAPDRALYGTICGFSCKSFSKANSSFSTFQSAMKSPNSTATSVRTFQATVGVLQRMAAAGQLAISAVSRGFSFLRFGLVQHQT